MSRTETSHGELHDAIRELHDAIRELHATVIARLAHIRGRKIISDQVLDGSGSITDQEAFDTVVAPATHGEGLLRRLFHRLFPRKSAADPNP